MGHSVRASIRASRLPAAAHATGELALTGVLMFATGSASAQEGNSSDEGLLQEVVVTAQLRQTNF
jgi:hypothetical protein